MPLPLTLTLPPHPHPHPHPNQELRGHTGTVWCVVAVGGWCVSGAADNLLKVWLGLGLGLGYRSSGLYAMAILTMAILTMLKVWEPCGHESAAASKALGSRL